MLVAATVATVATIGAQPAVAAAEKCDTKNWDYTNGPTSYDGQGNVTIQNTEWRQCSTLLRASKAEGTGAGDSIANSTWKFTGDVHLEVDGAVLDAQAATVTLVDNHVQSVEIPAAVPKKPVHIEFKSAVLDVDSAAVAFTEGRIKTIQALGTPAQFSYLIRKSGQHVHGHSPRIDYDADKTLMRFVDASYSYGNDDATTEMLAYNIDDGSMVTGKTSGVYRPDEKVPAPRTPDRTSAK